MGQLLVSIILKGIIWNQYFGLQWFLFRFGSIVEGKIGKSFAISERKKFDCLRSYPSFIWRAFQSLEPPTMEQFMFPTNRTVLEPFWNCSGTVLEPFWNCSGMVQKTIPHLEQFISSRTVPPSELKKVQEPFLLLNLKKFENRSSLWT